MKKPMLSLLAIMFAAITQAATTQADCTAYLETSDEGVADSSFNHGNHWSDKTVPGESSVNYVGTGLVIRDPGGSSDVSYPGQALALAGKFVSQCKGGAAVNWSELRLQDGAIYRWSSFGHVKGRVKVESTEANPARFTMFYPASRNTCSVDADFVGASDAVVVFDREGDGPTVAMPDMEYRLGGDWSGYDGTLVIPENGQVSLKSGVQVAGGVRAESGGYLTMAEKYGTVSVGALDMRAGSILQVSVSWQGGLCSIAVGKRLSLERAEVQVSVDSSVTYAGKPPKFEIFHLSSEAVAAGVKLDRAYVRFIWANTPAIGALAKLVAEDDGQGGQHVYATFPVADFTMTKANGSTANSAFAPGNESYWVDSLAPKADSTGLAFLSASTSLLGGDSEYAFPDLDFALSDASLYLQCKRFSAKELIMAAGGRVYTYTGPGDKNATLATPVTVLPGRSPVTFSAYGGFHMNLTQPISGCGDVTFVQSGSGNGYYHLQAGNSGFSGNLKLEGAGTGATYYYISGVTCPFGGAYDGATAWKSLTFAGKSGQVNARVLGDVSLDDPTRGMFVDGYWKFEVDGNRTLKIAEPVTYNGELCKSGAGCLALGGAARFADGRPETEPSSSLNLLTLKAGTYRFLSTNAVNGVQVAVDSGVTLLLDPTPAGEGMSEFGAINTRWSTPFLISDASGKLAVKVDSDPIFKTAYQPFTVAICTVDAEAAKGIEVDLDRSAVENALVNEVRRTNADGSVTIAVEFRRPGMVIFIR